MPENLGNEELDAFNTNPPRLPADVIANAQANLVVRDGFASFFWHPYLVSDPRAGTAHLRQIVQGIKALGYTFVSASSVAAGDDLDAAQPSSAADLGADRPGGHTGVPHAASPTSSGVLRPLVAATPGAGARSAPADRQPPEPERSIGEQLLADPDEGPVAAVEPMTIYQVEGGLSPHSVVAPSFFSNHLEGTTEHVREMLVAHSPRYVYVDRGFGARVLRSVVTNQQTSMAARAGRPRNVTLRVMTIFGTRPEAVKMAPIVTGSHRRSAGSRRSPS